MENLLKNEIDEIAAEQRRNPIHILRWLEKEERLKKTPELFIKHRSFYTEDFVFEPDEDIMVYADFNYPLPKPALGEPPEFGEYPPHRHEFFEMFYVYSGTCRCIYGGETYVLKPGSLWIFNTRCRHGIHNSDDGFIFNIMVRRSAAESNLLEMLGENDLFLNFFLNSIHGKGDTPAHMCFELNAGEAAELYLFGIIREYYRKQHYSQSMLKLMYASMLLELSRKYRSAPLPSDGPDCIIAEIMAYISDHRGDVTLQKLSEKFHYSPAYISRMLLRRTGKNFSDYIRSFRLDRAGYLLAHTELSVDKIAELSGYSQRSSFDKEFKKYCGKTPSAFRREK